MCGFWLCFGCVLVKSSPPTSVHFSHHKSWGICLLITSVSLLSVGEMSVVASTPSAAAGVGGPVQSHMIFPKRFYTESELTAVIISCSSPPTPAPASDDDVQCALLPALWRIVIGYIAREECERPLPTDRNDFFYEKMYEHLGEMKGDHSLCDGGRFDPDGKYSACEARYCDRCVVRGCVWCTDVKKRGVRACNESLMSCPRRPSAPQPVRPILKVNCVYWCGCVLPVVLFAGMSG